MTASGPVRHRLLALALSGAAALAAGGGSAHAGILPAQTLDGPGAAILDVGGAALAPDGTGGVVYRKLVDGLPRVFVARWSRGSWSRPIRVDHAQRFAATQPAIAAGNDGRLVVAWVTPWAVRRDRRTRFQLMAAVLDPGARGFGQAIEVDPRDVGDGSAATPSLAMAPGGAAWIVYRVVTNALDRESPAVGIQPMRPGDQLVDVRVARFNGLTWSSLGDVNRLGEQVTMRRPSASNAPRIGTNRRGDAAVVTWQEPGVDGVARIWARRLFSHGLGTVLPVSPAALDGTPVDRDADAPALAVSALSEAKVAFRLDGRDERALFVNTLPPSIDERAQAFTGAARVEGGAALGAPSVAVDEDGGFTLGWSAGGAVRQLGGDIDATRPPASLEEGGGADEVLVTHAATGGGVTAWRGADGGRPVVKVRQDFGDGQWHAAHLTAPLSGPVDGLAAGGAERGDALVAFRQGPAEQSQVVAALASSRPSAFTATTPERWVRPAGARVRWSAARVATGSARYAIVVDGQVRASGLTRRFHRLDPRGLGDGVHEVEVVASDREGQETSSAGTQLRVDASPPLVTVRRVGRRRVEVRVRDGASGLRRAATRIAFGDRSRAVRGRARARHRYRRAGRFVVTVRSADRAGHRSTWRGWVEVR